MEGLNMTIRALLKSFRKDERGATAIEYGLIVGIVATTIITIFGTGTALSTLYDTIAAVVTALS